MRKIKHIDDAVEKFRSEKHVFQRFMNAVIDSFTLEPGLNKYGNPVIHSMKHRIKDSEHLREKLHRKKAKHCIVNKDNIFDVITDLVGVRVLHLHQEQLKPINEFIFSMVEKGDWVFYEKPIAYSWDPESQKFFSSLGLRVEIKESYYTSIHYVVHPATDPRIKCEIQVRTLFEEIWGEIDHTVNYPSPSESAATREQLRVLSKLVSTGTRLADSIFRLN